MKNKYFIFRYRGMEVTASNQIMAYKKFKEKDPHVREHQVLLFMQVVGQVKEAIKDGC
jgi:hypothetical protein